MADDDFPPIEENNPDYLSEDEQEGLDFDFSDYSSLRSYLMQQCQISVDSHDPIMLLWHLHLLLLKQQKVDQSQFRDENAKAFIEALNLGSTNLQKQINSALKKLQDETLNGLVSQNIERLATTRKDMDGLVDDFTKQSNSILLDFKRQRRFMIGISLFNAGVLAISFFILYYIIQ